jgi:hypothetical protein
MNNKFLKIVGIGFILSVSTLANATLIDNGDYSADTVSGLDWLDWTLTRDKTQTEALAQFGGAGWRMATSTEAVGLMENHFDVDVLGGFANGNAIQDLAIKHDQFVALFGITHLSDRTYSKIEGIGLIGSDGHNVLAGYLNANYGGTNQHAYYMGVALVRAAAVPEPAIIALFALGLVGIGFARRRQS